MSFKKFSTEKEAEESPGINLQDMQNLFGEKCETFVQDILKVLDKGQDIPYS